MVSRALPFALIAACFVYGCGGNTTQSSSGTNPYSADTRNALQREEAVKQASKQLEDKSAKEVTDGMNALGIKLLQSGFNGKDNIALSPVSIAQAMGMALNGAGGETRKEMAATLGMPKLGAEPFNTSVKALRELLSSADPKVQIRIANAIFARKGVAFVPDFMKQNESTFGAQTMELDFADEATPKVINDWVSVQTEKKIPVIVEKIEPELVMLLVNAVYFKGLWRDPFEPKMTVEKPFHVSAEKTVPAKMMIREGTYGYAKGQGAQWVGIPFGNGRFQFVAALPEAGVEDFVKGLSAKSWGEAITGMSQQMVALSLPKFKLSWDATLNKALQDAGMKSAFEAASADFSGMRREKDVFVSRVIHKAVFEVDEQGAEAAAVTSIGMATTAIQVPTTVVFDKPFLVSIRDSASGAVLFFGVVANPS